MVGPSTTGAGATATVGGAAVAAAAAAKPTPMSLAKDIFRVDGFAGFYKGCVQYENAAAYAAFHQTSATTSTVPFPIPSLSLALALALSHSLSSSLPLAVCISTPIFYICTLTCAACFGQCWCIREYLSKPKKVLGIFADLCADVWDMVGVLRSCTKVAAGPEQWGLLCTRDDRGCCSRPSSCWWVRWCVCCWRHEPNRCCADQVAGAWPSRGQVDHQKHVQSDCSV